MTNIGTIQFCANAAAKPALLAACRQLTKVAIAQGELLGRRGTVEDHSAIVWFGRANAPVAFATFFDGGHRRIWIDIVYVRREFRRRGCGRAMLAEIEARAKARGGFDELHFGTALENDVMRAVAAGTGFAERYIDLVKEIAK